MSRDHEEEYESDLDGFASDAEPEQPEQERKQPDVKDFECCVCMEVMVEPVATPCRHVFCRPCLRLSLEVKRACPMCRAAFPASFSATRAVVESDMQNEVSRLFPERALALRAELDRQQAAYAESAACRRTIVFGNRYERVANPKVSYNKHRWTAFVDLPNVDARQYIEKVVFGLHDTFGCDQAVRSPPYECKRVGWGTFEMTITVHWRRHLRMPPTELEHWLSFERRGGRARKAVVFPERALEAAGLLSAAGSPPRSPRRSTVVRRRSSSGVLGQHSARRSAARQAARQAAPVGVVNL